MRREIRIETQSWDIGPCSSKRFNNHQTQTRLKIENMAPNLSSLWVDNEMSIKESKEQLDDRL